MSFGTISQCVGDPAFGARVNACIAAEQITRGLNAAPGALYGDLVWNVAAADDVEQAYASALAAENPNPGGDESVITDQMILSHVQASWPAAR